MHSGCKCQRAIRCPFNSAENNWRKPIPRKDDLIPLLSWRHQPQRTMVGKVLNNHSQLRTAETHHRQTCYCPSGKFVNCKRKTCLASGNAWATSNNLLGSAVNDGRNQDRRTCNNSPQITTSLQDNLAGLTCITAVKRFPQMVGPCREVHECPSLNASNATSSPLLRDLPTSALLSQSNASADKQPSQLPSKPAEPEMYRSGGLFTALPKCDLKCASTEEKRPDWRYSEDLICIRSGETMPVQKNDVAFGQLHQGHSPTAQLPCFVGDLNFSKLPSPQLSPVKLDQETAMASNSPLSRGCSNELIAFIMGPELPSISSDEDDDGDWDDWDDESSDDAPESNGSAQAQTSSDVQEKGSSTKSLSEPKGENVPTPPVDAHDGEIRFLHKQSSPTDQLTCLMKEIHFAKLPSPQLSPVKLNQQIAMSPKNKGCGNNIIAFIMGSGFASEYSDEAEDDDSDWEEWDVKFSDEAPENNGSVQVQTYSDIQEKGCFARTPSEAKREEVPTPQTSAATDAHDGEVWFPHDMDEINRKWLLAYSTDQTPLDKKVCFASDDCLVIAYEAEEFVGEEEERDSLFENVSWEQLARDRCRFERKIREFSLVIEPILGSAHRDRIYNTRIVPWMEQQQHCDS